MGDPLMTAVAAGNGMPLPMGYGIPLPVGTGRAPALTPEAARLMFVLPGARAPLGVGTGSSLPRGHGIPLPVGTGRAPALTPEAAKLIASLPDANPLGAATASAAKHKTAKLFILPFW